MKRDYKELFAAGIIENAKCENPFLNVTGEVVRLLEEAILTMRLEPYEKLNISHLAEALEVSTTTIRDAFAVLEQNMFIEIIKEEDRIQRQYRVKGMDHLDVERLFTVRRAIESESAYLCAKWMHLPDLPFLEKNVSDFVSGISRCGVSRKEEIFDELTMLDRSFHEAIVKFAGNPFLNRTYGSISKYLKQLSYQSSSALLEEDHSRLVLLGHQHQSILNAIKLGFPGQAHDLMNDHLDYSMNAVIRFMR